MIKSVIIHFGIAIAFAIMIAGITDFTTVLPIDIGWHFLTVFYILILIGLISFYWLTSYTNIWLTILSFILNFIIWVTEQVNFEKLFHDTFFYEENKFRYGVIVLGGILWTFNKLIIDRIFVLCKLDLSLKNRIEKL
jgi:hypothetical protein